MKIRNGFVSNSSSSSFMILGVQLDQSELNKIDDEGVDAREKFEEEGLSYYGFDGSGAAVGIDFHTIWRQIDPKLRDAITADVRSKLKKVMGRDVQVDIESGEYPC